MDVKRVNYIMKNIMEISSNVLNCKFGIFGRIIFVLRQSNMNIFVFIIGIIILTCFTIAMKVSVNDSKRPLNYRPIIGILAQELSSDFDATLNANYKSYIAASYVKYIEGSGARVVPIFINKDEKYYKNLMFSINGVLFPGGAVHFEDANGYAAVGAIIYKYAKQMNDNGDYFPLWGTCLGFELMTYLAANEEEHRCDCWSNNQALPLDFKKDFRNSKLFGPASKEIIEILSSQPVTPNFHQYCVTEKNMSTFKLLDEWHILATNRDLEGLEFVSVIESRIYPFYSIMAHPEKNGYEWKVNKNNPHSPDAIKVMQYFGNFFVSEAHKSAHSFSSLKEERSSLIYNYVSTYTGDKLVFEQCYFFT